MASISTEPNGRKRIQFVDSNGERKAIRLGDVSMKQAEAFKVKLESLIGARITGGNVSDEVSRWLSDLPDDVHAKLSGVGLVDTRTGTTLGAWLEGYMSSRTDAKLSTLIAMGQAKGDLLKFLGPSRTLASITPGDGDDFCRWLLGERKLSPNTARRRCGRGKQFFRAAVRKRLIQSNPFTDLKSRVQGNPEKAYFLSRADSQKILDACPDIEWRLLFALSRFGGLRCPSEHLLLTWADVDWSRSRLTVHSPKTEHHEGKASRTIPIFPELLPHLREAFEQADAGATHLITRYRDARQNLRTHFTRIIRRAGLEPWPKLFHNLRATRQTELAETFPIQAVCEWIGNSVAVAKGHYLQVTEAHYELAIKATDDRAVQNPAHSSEAPFKLVHNAAQSASETPRICMKLTTVTNAESPGISGGFRTIPNVAESRHWPQSDSNRHALAGKGF